MRSAEDIAFEKITDSLAEIKDVCQNISIGLAFCQREIDEIKKAKKASAERVSAKLDQMIIGMSNLGLLLKGLTAPGIITSFKVTHPGIIDTTPKEMYAELTEAANEVGGEIDQRCKAFGEKMAELTADRDSTQYLSDCVALLKEMRSEIVSRRERIESLKQRRRNADKDSYEQKNAALLIFKVRSMIEPLEKFSYFVFDSYFAKRKRMMAEIWRTSVAIEEMYDETSTEYKERIPSASESHKIGSALKELNAIARRHEVTHKANCLVWAGNMSALERRKILAGLKNS